MRQFKLIIGISVLLVAAGSLVAVDARAGDKPAHGPVPFAEFDQDGSGFVSEDEFNTVRGARMAANAEAGMKMKGAASAPAFADVDTDDDGKLSSDEIAAAHKAHKQKMGGMKHQHASGDGAGDGHGSGHGAGHKKGMNGTDCDCDCKGKGKGHMGKKKANMPMFEDFDLNADGKIVEDEFNQAHAGIMAEMAAAGHQMKHAGEAPGFSGIDSNGDGEISREEFSAHKAAHHKGMHKQGT